MTELIRLETLAEAQHFNDHVFEQVAPYLGRQVLEVGTGIGTFTERLLDRGAEVVGVEIVPEFVRIARQRLGHRPHVLLLEADMGAGIPAGLAGRAFDTVVCMNVLEHIEDDERALANFFTLLRPGGNLVLVVPQYPWLYNRLDSNDGHYRRYRRRGLEATLARAGFRVARTGTFNLAGIVGWFVNGSLLRRKDLPTQQMRFYDRLAPYLFRLESVTGPPAGLSLLVVAERPPG